MNLNQNTLNIIFLFLFFSPETLSRKFEFKNSQRVFANSSSNKDEKFGHEILFSSKDKSEMWNKFFFFTCFMHVRPPFRKDWAFEKSCPMIYSCSFNIRGWIRIWKIEQDDDSTVKTIRNWIFPFEASFPRKLIPRRMLNYFQER